MNRILRSIFILIFSSIVYFSPLMLQSGQAEAGDQIAIAIEDGGLLIIDVQTGMDVALIPEAENGKAYTDVKITPDNKYAVAYSKGSYRSAFGYYVVLDLSTNTIINVIDENTSLTDSRALWITKLEVSSDSKTANHPQWLSQSCYPMILPAL